MRKRDDAGFIDVAELLSVRTIMATERLDLDQLDNAKMLELLNAGLEGDEAALQKVVVSLMPIVQFRVVKALLRRVHQARGRNLRADVEDLVQEVFASLFAKQGRALRQWDPGRGLSFTKFVSLLADREVGMTMRRNKRNPWTEEPTTESTLHEMAGVAADPQARAESRQLLQLLTERLRDRLTPQGQVYFQQLYIEQMSIQDVAQAHGTTPGALYTWRSRLIKLIREIEGQLQSEGPDHA